MAGWLRKIRSQGKWKITKQIGIGKKRWYARKQKSNIKKTYNKDPRYESWQNWHYPKDFHPVPSTQYPYVQQQGYARKGLSQDKKPMTGVRPSWAKCLSTLNHPCLQILEYKLGSWINLTIRVSYFSPGLISRWGDNQTQFEIFLTQSAEIGTLDLNITILQQICLGSHELQYNGISESFPHIFLLLL